MYRRIGHEVAAEGGRSPDARIGHEVAAEGGRSPDAIEVFLSAMNFLRGYHMAGPGLLMFRPIFRTFCLYMFSV